MLFQLQMSVFMSPTFPILAGTLRAMKRLMEEAIYGE